jgi:hypothetical protein
LGDVTEANAGSPAMQSRTCVWFVTNVQPPGGEDSVDMNDFDFG